MCDYKIGQHVKVVDPGETYETYLDMFLKHDLKNLKIGYGTKVLKVLYLQ